MANSHQALTKLLSAQLNEAQRTILDLRVELAETEERVRTAGTIPTQPPPTYDDFHADKVEQYKYEIKASKQEVAEAMRAKQVAEDRADAAEFRVQVLQSQAGVKEAEWLEKIKILKSELSSRLKETLLSKKEKMMQKIENMDLSDVEAEERTNAIEFRVQGLESKTSETEAGSLGPEVRRAADSKPPAMRPSAAKSSAAKPFVAKPSAAKPSAAKPSAAKATPASASGAKLAPAKVKRALAARKTGGKKITLAQTIAAKEVADCIDSCNQFAPRDGPTKRASAAKAMQNFVYNEDETDDEEVLPSSRKIKEELASEASAKKRKHDQCAADNAADTWSPKQPLKSTTPPPKKVRLPICAGKMSAPAHGTPSSQTGQRESFSLHRSLQESSDFEFKMVTVYTNPAKTLFQGYQSTDLNSNVAEFWELLSPLKDAWEARAGADWSWDFEKTEMRSKGRVCVNTRLQRATTVWHEGDTGFFACKRCAAAGRPCITWAGEQEGFHCLPLHHDDRKRAVEEGFEIRYWINER